MTKILVTRKPYAFGLLVRVPIRFISQENSVGRRTFFTRPICHQQSEKRSSSNNDPPPRIWQAACRRLPRTQILPEYLGGPPNQGFQAFVGDKILGAAAALVMEETISTFLDGSSESNKHQSSLQKELSVDRGCSTELLSIALSNRFLSARSKLLLPEECLEVSRGMGDHGVGTMVEAAVAAVYESDGEAVTDLARWLVAASARTWIEANPKGRLLERGGRVRAIRAGGPDHDPIFQGIAEVGGGERGPAVARASDRKSAERAAARKMLVSLGWMSGGEEESYWSPAEKSGDASNGKTSMDGQASNEWVPFQGFMSLDTLVLSGGESGSEWWARKAHKPSESFRRALFAPRIFDRIKNVDSWTRLSDPAPSAGTVEEAGLFVVMMVVEFRNEHDTTSSKYECFIEEGASRTKARSLAGIKANRFIGGLVGLEKDGCCTEGEA